MLWQSSKYCSHVMTVKQILQPCYDSQATTAAMLWQSSKYCSHVMTVKQILQPCYDSQANTAAMLWQSSEYCSHVMTVKQILQPCYDSQANTAAMLWQSSKYCSHVMTVKQTLLHEMLQEYTHSSLSSRHRLSCGLSSTLHCSMVSYTWVVFFVFKENSNQWRLAEASLHFTSTCNLRGIPVHFS